MTPSEQLQSYLSAIERRLSWREAWKGAALLSWVALAATVALVLLADRFAFSDTSLFWCRAALFLSLGSALVFGIVLPVLRMNRKRAAREVERRISTLDQRLLTATETPESNPFRELLAEEVLNATVAAPPEQLATTRRLAAFGLLAGGAAGVLIWLIAAGPGFLGYGAARLWAGTPRAAAEPLYGLDILPGDARVRKGADQMIEARTRGYEPQAIRLFARASQSVKWEQLPMERMPGSPGYTFLFAGLSETIEYQVEAGKLKSRIYTIRVVDLPGVKKIRVSYEFPKWTALPVAVEDPGGDLRAVEGTQATLEVETDRPLSEAFLVMEDGSRLALESIAPNRLRGRLTIQKDGMYHVAALDQGEAVRISEDYFIEARKEKGPEVRIARPGRDARVSPIEEVTIEVTGSDDFGLQELELRYSVNGGQERVVPLLSRKGTESAAGSAVIALEEFNLAPGDIVAFYGQARDARNTARTDVFFLEAQPFEREIRQSQTAGGMGGGMMGAQDENEISKRQKEIIAATWNQVRASNGAPQAKENAEFLSGVQKKLAEQARSLARRMNSRQLSGENEEFARFSKEMDQAARAMDEASDRLGQQSWRDALSPEQRALQHILRAESIFREIQVAFGQSGRGGQPGSSGRDLESLFDLELDTEKNQYETGQQQAQSGADPRTQEVDEAIRRLEDLARRQQQLAENQRRQPKQNFEQRWAQEMLRRDAEELRRQLEQMAQGQQGQSSSQQSGQSQQSGATPRQQQSSSSSGSGQSQNSQQQAQGQRSLQQMAGSGQQQQFQSERIERALREVERAMDDMRQAAAPQGSGGDPASARRAAERMAEARDSLGRMRNQESGKALDALAGQAQELAERQRSFEQKLREAFPQATPGRPAPAQAPPNREASERLADEKSRLERDYQRLEQGMRESLRGLGGQRQAANKLREALGEAQQNEIGLRLKYGAEGLKRGYGAYLAPRERVVTQALDQLSEKVKQAQQAAGENGAGGEERAERALEGIERLRAALDRQGSQPGRQGQQGQSGREGQSGQQQGQTGEQPGQQPGQQAGGMGPGGRRQGEAGREPGGQRQGGNSDAGFRDYSALNDGSLRGPEAGGRGNVERAYSDALSALERLRQSGGSMETQQEAERLIRRMQQLDPNRFPGNPELLARLRGEILPGLEQLELMLRRDLDQNRNGQVRTDTGARVPPKYADAVADYYRRLSRPPGATGGTVP